MDSAGRKRTKRQTPPPPGFKIYTISDVRSILGISRTTLWSWLRQGHLPPPRLIGPGPNARRGWPSPEFDRWLMSRPTAPTGPDAQEASA
jgi:predicted DNA-binding transcriptional regulator AlpA